MQRVLSRLPLYQYARISRACLGQANPEKQSFVRLLYVSRRPVVQRGDAVGELKKEIGDVRLRSSFSLFTTVSIILN